MQDKRKYGWLPSLPDIRDRTFKVPQIPITNVEIDLKDGFPSPCYNQLSLGSCCDNATAALFQFDQKKQKLPIWMPSRLYLYYYARLSMGSEYTGVDSGSTVRDAIKSLVRGTCSEKAWSYSDGPFKYKIKPPCWCDSSAQKNHGLVYESVAQDEQTMKHVLLSGYPFAVGISVYESFETQAVATTGNVPMPSPHEQLLGGHCVVVCGVSDSKGYWLCRNSWGQWAKEGYFFLPKQYLLDSNLASDFWVVRTIVENA